MFSSFKTLFVMAALVAAPALAACSGPSAAEANAETASAVSALSSKLPTLSGEHVWTVDKQASTLQFNAEHNGDKFTGDFSAFAAAIKLDLADPSSGEIHALIDLSSIDAKDDDRNANLLTKAWFDIAAHPTAKFSSTEITGSLAEGFLASGELSIKGISRPVVLAFKVSETGGTATAIGKAAFLRTDFSLGTGSDFKTEEWVKFPIEVLVNITAAR